MAESNVFRHGSIYKTSRAFSRDEAFGLARLTRRAAVAIPTNIAEGQAR
jgi:four helix bundle protein